MSRVPDRRHGRSESCGHQARYRHVHGWGAGDTGWESGTSTLTNASSATIDIGRHLSVSHKSNGKWLYYHDTYNSARPLSAAAPAEEKKLMRASLDVARPRDVCRSLAQHPFTTICAVHSCD